MVTYGDPFQGFPGRECSKVLYCSLSSGDALGLCSLPKATQACSFHRMHSGELNSQCLAPQPDTELWIKSYSITSSLHDKLRTNIQETPEGDKMPVRKMGVRQRCLALENYCAVNLGLILWILELTLCFAWILQMYTWKLS